jgi:hypothetical protein
MKINKGATEYKYQLSTLSFRHAKLNKLFFQLFVFTSSNFGILFLSQIAVKAGAVCEAK